ncbi:uncharacterized protein LOC100378599 [Saccoglossus kowalevskii]|uniref:Uncharacterized protein LOC100378599 n=1 Tax=Saccoglossus kowalevskii TaxID=10224 RepID=A0ABM0MY99_SACKO|nr:PREDICTED: uncharacterized protein LOC100378599 [Saccoglossus kowalevskii]
MVFQTSAKQQRMDVSSAASGLLLLATDTMTEPHTTEAICNGTPVSDLAVSTTQPANGQCTPDSSKDNKIETVDKGVQTDFKSQEIDLLIRLRVENTVLKNELTLLKNSDHISPTSVEKRYFSVNDVEGNEAKCKFYTGLTWLQFMSLWNFLGPARDKLLFWKRDYNNEEASPNLRRGPERKLDSMNELFLTLVRLRVGLLHQDIAYRFGISKGHVTTVVTTWIQLLYKQFSRLRSDMFPSRDIVKRNLPACFKKFRDIRVIIDCSEFFVYQSTHFKQQGNMYSSYKNHVTYKVLIGIAPSGAITYVSDAFEGSISDKEIVQKSGFLDLLSEGDLILADRGFTIRDLLFEKKADLNIPPFLGNRDKLSAAEEIQTKQIARVRIHVERAIERIKKFRLLKKKNSTISTASVFTNGVCGWLSC